MGAPVAAEALDKSTWAPGAWQGEADSVSLVDAASGYSILLNRDTTGGHWLAFVGVPPGHLAYGVADPSRIGVGAMGGLSYAGPLANGDTRLWWLGFSCGSAGALQPLLRAGTVYVSQALALALAKQLARDLVRLGGLAALGLAVLGAVATPTLPGATSTATSTANLITTTPSSVTITVPPITTILSKL